MSVDLAVYPQFDLYPQMQIAKEIEGCQIEVASIVEYPRFNICKKRVHVSFAFINVSLV